jgi:hypothetical protein
MIPDICASLEDPGPGKSHKRYVDWYNKWVKAKFTFPDQAGNPKVWISAEDCFQLRCSLIHAGTAEIDPAKRNILDEFKFFESGEIPHLTWYQGNVVNGVLQPNWLQLRVDRFSEELFKAADEWDLATTEDADIQKAKDQLLIIHPKGTIIGGIKFG